MKNLIKWLLTISILCYSIVVFAGNLVNINTADLKTLISLELIGKVKAQAIIDYREQNGPFKSLKDLLKVKGVGEKAMQANQDRIILEDQEDSGSKTDG